MATAFWTEDEDIYKMFEITPGTSINKAKKTYMKLVLKWHPDKNKAPEAPVVFMKIKKAWTYLEKPECFKTYEASLMAKEARKRKMESEDGDRVKMRANLAEREARAKVAAESTKKKSQHEQASQQTKFFMERMMAEARAQAQINPFKSTSTSTPSPSPAPAPSPSPAPSSHTFNSAALEATRVKVKWPKEKAGSVSVDTLRTSLSLYGDIDVCIAKGTTAFVHYFKPSAAAEALKRGPVDFPHFTFSRDQTTSAPPPPAPSPSPSPSPSSSQPQRKPAFPYTGESTSYEEETFRRMKEMKARRSADGGGEGVQNQNQKQHQSYEDDTLKRLKAMAAARAAAKTSSVQPEGKEMYTEEAKPAESGQNEPVVVSDSDDL